ncbi:zinc finger protein with KRAB and SCAN domains 5-like isoform X2 [Armigeres subalbatus]|uniref:zinc finger protein with KRAB and SCAN domains 5-like isoform X2 n=1 Tax=Armigeres subalbatus TaxID=124917 RepID=UPI002ED25BDA
MLDILNVGTNWKHTKIDHKCSFPRTSHYVGCELCLTKARENKNASAVCDGAIQDDDDLDVSCAVRGCGMTKEENPSLLFFSVPRDQSERRRWLLQIGMLDNAIDFYRDTVLAVCELHFDLSKDLLNYDDVISMGRTAMLKENVMPSRNVPSIGFTQDTFEDTLMPKQEVTSIPEDDDELSLLEEMPDRNGGNDQAMPEYPDHMQPSPIEEFVHICRSCLCTDKVNLVSAFDDRLADIFLQFTNVNIDENEGISTMICIDCKSRLLDIHFFRDTCVTNTQVLLHRYQKCYGLAAHNDLSHLGSMEDDDTLEVTPNTTDNSRYEMGADDPEDLLMPQKEEAEPSIFFKPKKPRGRPPKVPATPPKTLVSPKPVESPKPYKSQKIAIMKKRFKCKFCRKEYNSRPGFEMHTATHKYHNQSDFTEECRRCDILTRKGEVHRCYTDILYCYVCGEKYGKWGHLKLHLAKKHKIKTKRRELMQKLKEMGYVVGPRVNALKIPPVSHVAQKEESEDDEDEYGTSNPLDQDKSASSRSVTNSPIEHQQQCSFCGVGFAYNSSLEMHLKTHSAIELTQCNECDSNYDSYYHLERHHDEHEDEYPLTEEIICRFCGKQLQRQQTLLLHYQYVHKDKNVVQCSTCPQLFGNALELSNHGCNGQRRKSVASSSTAATNGDFVIIKPESILKGKTSAAMAMNEDDSNSIPVGMQGADGADPLLGLGNEEVIDLDSDDEEDLGKDDSSQEKTSYDCSMCDKQFTKQDILERHMKLHRMMNDAKANEIGLRNSFFRAMNCRREVSQPI